MEKVWVLMAEENLQAVDQRFVVPARPVATWNRFDDGAEADGGPLAPLIFNAWYVIAPSRDVDRSLKSIRVLGEPLVFFRSQEGKPIVLDDRCAHRRYPLSKGVLKGDAIQCGYHGFTYAASGQCVWAPGAFGGQQREEALPFGVRSYPCAERGPWLWVWMGPPDQADVNQIPLPPIESAPGCVVDGYKLNPANYMMMIENLHDVSHLHFLHGATSASFVDAAPVELPAPPDSVSWEKVTDQAESGIIAQICGDDPARLVRLEDGGTQFGPSLTFGYQRRKPLPDESDLPRPASLTIAHAITPQDYRSTHQFFLLASSDPFTQDMAKVIFDAQEVVFEQDVGALRDMQAYVETDARPGRVEFSMVFDKFGVKMRRILKAMKDRELAEARSVTGSVQDSHTNSSHV